MNDATPKQRQDMDLSEWLEELGLGQYAAAFEENHLTLESLHEMTGDDLKECGVTSLGHRKKLLAEIAKLKVGAESRVEPSVGASKAGSGAPQKAAPAETPRSQNPVPAPTAQEVRSAAPLPPLAPPVANRSVAPKSKPQPRRA